MKEKSPEAIAFGQFIKGGRTALDWSQAEAAKRIGISQVYYCQIETAKRNVDLTLALKICKILRLDFNNFSKNYT